GNSRQVVAGENIRAAAVSADGSSVVYTQERDGKLELRSVGTLIRSIDAQYGAGFGVLLSNDGGRASVREFLDPMTVHALWLDCTAMELHDLGPARNGADVISGDGRSLWMFLPDGYLAHASLDTGETTL